MSLVLNVMREFPQSEQHLRSGLWGSRGPYPLTTSLYGKTLGILGFGRIGEAIAKRAEAFGMKIRYHNRNRKSTSHPYDPDPEALARASTVLLVATPGGKQTEKLVGAKLLDALGPQGYLVNISRGSVIDEAALLEALRERRIAGAGLDVFESEPNVNPEFFALPNAVLYPHVGSATHETRYAMGMLQVENLRAHFAGKPVLTRVV
jgi:lactate dehydrogenase-like 2-hydroxyacid dehydrogenase